ncbi:hypothetical protein [Erythrobacter sp. HL-111]|uniref:hypothetical protein n=1 Tax=Erythrobacter sp. HL-111 TaxID=1798193 RepID=UPI0006D961DB|nr:hypothetical protein [Erythrobacter sp. HL-111]KPP92915.1 MAG: putative exported protein [Erythrobacteraceae bacterium HL-111]SDT01595.1 hypothetical protein SAMN04515621_2722 [Erythrobacter sp. HL-111]
MTRFVSSSALALILAAGLAAPAHADVQITGTVDVDKDITITVDTDKDKDVDVDVDFDADLQGSAKSDAIVNATVDDVTIGPVEGQDEMGIDKTVSTIGSVNENTGIVQFNQEGGAMINQGNVISAAAIFSGDEDFQIAMSEAYADQRITDSESTHTEGFENLAGLVDDNGDVTLDGDFEYDLTAQIVDSYNGNTGIAMGNQAVGNGANQHNVLSLAVGDNALVALSDAGLGQQNSGNQLTDVNTLKQGEVVGSLNGNAGIVAVNQSTGHFNNQATVVSVAALTSAVGLGQ